MSLLHTAETQTAAVMALAFTPDGTLLLTAALDGVVSLWGIP